MKRKLTVIVSADVVGYSGLMERDEAGTLARLKANRKSICDPCIERHGGRIVKLMGDGALIEFASVVAAVENKAIEQRRTTNPEAYKLYLMARQYNAMGNSRHCDITVRICERAVEIDPHGVAW